MCASRIRSLPVEPDVRGNPVVAGEKARFEGGEVGIRLARDRGDGRLDAKAAIHDAGLEVRERARGDEVREGLVGEPVEEEDAHGGPRIRGDPLGGRVRARADRTGGRESPREERAERRGTRPSRGEVTRRASRRRVPDAARASAATMRGCRRSAAPICTATPRSRTASSLRRSSWPAASRRAFRCSRSRITTRFTACPSSRPRRRARAS